MAKGVTARTAWQIMAKKHADFAKQHPEWMGQANEALKAWGDQEMTLQHAIAVALSKAYGAGMRGEYPEPINYFDRYKETVDETETNHSGGARVMRRGSKTAPTNGADVLDASSPSSPVVRRRGSKAEAAPVIRRRS